MAIAAAVRAASERVAGRCRFDVASAENYSGSDLDRRVVETPFNIVYEAVL